MTPVGIFFLRSRFNTTNLSNVRTASGGHWFEADSGGSHVIPPHRLAGMNIERTVAVEPFGTKSRGNHPHADRHEKLFDPIKNIFIFASHLQQIARERSYDDKGAFHADHAVCNAGQPRLPQTADRGSGISIGWNQSLRAH